MTVLVAVLALVLVLAVAVLAVLMVVVAGIRGDERRLSLSEAPLTRTGAVARRVLGVHAAPGHNHHRTHADARR
jgi:hypothetical protein